MNIKSNSSPAEYILANERNIAAWLPYFGKLGECHLDNPPGVKRSLTHIPLALFNSVMDSRLAPEAVDAAVQTILADARAWNVPLRWWIGPSSRPADLGKYLENYGFSLNEAETGMALDLAKLKEDLPAVANFSIRLAQDEADLQTWVQTLAAGNQVPATAQTFHQGWLDFMRSADQKAVLAYLGFLDGKPIATSLLFLDGDIAGIYAVATVPEARQKGIGAWMTQRPLIQARSQGCRLGILQASEMGLGIYRSLGFQECFKLVTYDWTPEN